MIDTTTPELTVVGSEGNKTVADPTASYNSMHPLWLKSRAICNGERFVKAYDSVIDPVNFRNILIPFSPSMTQAQYDFYKSEAELPGIVAQYAKIIVGGLLRKQPQLKLPEGVPAEAAEWIMDHFSQDDSPIVSFLDNALWEEMQTSRAWVYVDYPFISESQKSEMTTEDFQKIKPYPVLWNAESVINYRLDAASSDGSQKLSMIIVRNYEEKYLEDGVHFHPVLLDTVWVHQLKDGYYQIVKYQNPNPTGAVNVINGKLQQDYKFKGSGFVVVDVIDNIEFNGERLDMIPAWPLNGSFKPVEPMLMPLIDREIALYNKVSRRNHLLYGASTYTPYVSSEMTDESFEAIVNSGLGSWIKIGVQDKIGVLDTPTAALSDMDRAIQNTIEELARMGIRMLSPETDQSGVALDIRNAAQTAQLGTLNTKVSNQMADIITFMLNWRYDLKLSSSDIEFELSADFNPAPLGADWLRLSTEWYQNGLIPRTVWLSILKQNDIINPDYDDEEGQAEINGDEMVVKQKEEMAYAAQLQQEVAASKAGVSPPVQQTQQPPQGK